MFLTKQSKQVKLVKGTGTVCWRPYSITFVLAVQIVEHKHEVEQAHILASSTIQDLLLSIQREKKEARVRAFRNPKPPPSFDLPHNTSLPLSSPRKHSADHRPYDFKIGWRDEGLTDQLARRMWSGRATHTSVVEINLTACKCLRIIELQRSSRDPR